MEDVELTATFSQDRRPLPKVVANESNTETEDSMGSGAMETKLPMEVMETAMVKMEAVSPRVMTPEDMVVDCILTRGRTPSPTPDSPTSPSPHRFRKFYLKNL